MNHFPDPDKRRVITGLTEQHITAAAKHLYGTDTTTDAARIDRNRLRNYITGRTAWTFPELLALYEFAQSRQLNEAARETKKALIDIYNHYPASK